MNIPQQTELEKIQEKNRLIQFMSNLANQQFFLGLSRENCHNEMQLALNQNLDPQNCADARTFVQRQKSNQKRRVLKNQFRQFQVFQQGQNNLNVGNQPQQPIHPPMLAINHNPLQGQIQQPIQIQNPAPPQGLFMGMPAPFWAQQFQQLQQQIQNPNPQPALGPNVAAAGGGGNVGGNGGGNNGQQIPNPPNQIQNNPAPNPNQRIVVNPNPNPQNPGGNGNGGDGGNGGGAPPPGPGNGGNGNGGVINQPNFIAGNPGPGVIGIQNFINMMIPMLCIQCNVSPKQMQFTTCNHILWCVVCFRNQQNNTTCPTCGMQNQQSRQIA